MPRSTARLMRRRISDTHDGRHHRADNSGHVIAVEQRVVERFVAEVVDVHGKALQQIQRIATGDIALGIDSLKSRENRIISCLARHRRLGGSNQFTENPPLLGWFG